MINEHTDHRAQLINRAYMSRTGMEVSNRVGVTRDGLVVSLRAI